MHNIYLLFVEFLTDLLTVGFIGVFAIVTILLAAFLIDTYRCGKKEGCTDETVND